MNLRTRTSIAALAVASVVGGGITGAVLTGPAAAFAQEAEDESTTEGPSITSDGAEEEGRCRGHLGGRLLGGASEDVAAILGVTVDELRETVRAGSSIADIAAENGADVQLVIDLLVVQAQERLDAAVADGRVTADEAAEKAAEIETRVTDMVNGELVRGGPGSGGRGGGEGRGGPGEPRGGGEELDSTETDV